VTKTKSERFQSRVTCGGATLRKSEIAFAHAYRFFVTMSYRSERSVSEYQVVRFYWASGKRVEQFEENFQPGKQGKNVFSAAVQR